MARSKIDGVVEGVRYTPDGKISVVRAYERRGVVWTDDVLLERKDLIDRLYQGKHFVVGVRKTYVGSVFNTGKPIQLTDGNIVTDGQSSGRDMLVGVGIF